MAWMLPARLTSGSLPIPLRVTLHLLTTLSCMSAEYAGSQACSGCHQPEFQKHSGSHHAHALQPITGSRVGAALLQARRSPDGRLEYQATSDGIVVQEPGLPESVTLQWAFGAGAQGITLVGMFGGQFMEHRFSYYTRLSGFAPTFGHPPTARTPISELGVLQDKRTVSNCFNCHATGLQRSGSNFSLAGLQPGVQCERCHGPGSTHIDAAQRAAPAAEIRRAVVNPRRLAPRAEIEVCGQCHRLPTTELGDEPELESPVTVRFAPIGLLASRCFRESQKVSCLTCHDPHANARPRTDPAYAQACLGCHATGGKPIKLCKRAAAENCLPCHMQQGRLERYLLFTDHRIRVY